MRKRFVKINHILNNNFRFLSLVWNVSKIQFLFKSIQIIVTSLIPALNIWMIQYLISLMEKSSNTLISFETVMLAVVGFFVAQITPQLINNWNSTLNSPRFMWQIKKSITNMLMKKAEDLDYSCFEDEEFYNKYTQGLSQTDSVSFKVFDSFFSFLSATITLISIIALIASTDYIVLIISAVAVLISFCSSVVISKANKQNEKMFIPFTRFANYIHSIPFDPEFAAEIRCNDVLPLCLTKYNKTTDGIIALSKSCGRRLLFLNIFFTVLHTLCDIFLYGFIMSKVVFGEYTIAMFSLLTNAAGQIENSLGSFTQAISNLYANSLDIDNLLYILDYSSNKKNNDGNTIDINEPCSIEFSHVSFRYPGSDNYALKDVSFYVKPAEKIAIVGENGSGKTTMIKLLLKLYLPEEGDILINGISINDINDEQYRHNIGIVLQNYKIFEFSIKENISFEKPLDEKIHYYSKTIGVEDILSQLAEGWDTVLSKRFGRNGTQLSGGETQKIAFLRALAKESFLYILDEPSAALDPRSEYNMNLLAYSIQNKTMLLTSHRLSSTIMADRIFFFEKGKLIEQGSHSDLMHADGKYAQLFHLQADNYRIDS